MKKVLIAAGGLLALLVIVVAIAVFVLAGQLDGKLAAPATPYPSMKASSDPDVIARGEYVVRVIGHCSQCHGDYKRSNPAGNTPDVALSGGFEFVMGPLATLYSANLTSDAETGIGRRSDEELARTLKHGVLANGQLSIFMRYAASNLSDEDIVAALSYLRSLPPSKNPVPPNDISILGKALFSLPDFSPDLDPPPVHVPPGEEPSVERGRYLAEQVVLCVNCHSQIDMGTFQAVGPKAGGADPDPSPGDDDNMVFVAPNLTAHPTGMTGKLDEEAFLARLRHGRVHTFSKMPWENVSRMSETDMRSVYRFLRSLPPVDNDVGPTYRDASWKPEG